VNPVLCVFIYRPEFNGSAVNFYSVIVTELYLRYQLAAAAAPPHAPNPLYSTAAIVPMRPTVHGGVGKKG